MRKALAVAVSCAWVMLAATFASAASAPKDKVIFSKKSLYRNIIVSEGANHRCMTFGKIYGQQSCIDPDNSNSMLFKYYQGLLTATAFSNDPQRILVLGLGGGVIPLALTRAYPNATVDAVELDPAVVDVARTYFNYRETPRLATHVDDARVFVRRQLRAGVRYDVVILDAFDKEFIPEHLLTKEFLSQVKGVLTPNGLVAANSFTVGRQVAHENATYQAVYGKVFEAVVGSGNRIIVAPMSPDEFDKKCREIADVPKLAMFSFDAVAIVRKVTLMDKSDVKPFTDQYSPVNLVVRY